MYFSAPKHIDYNGEGTWVYPVMDKVIEGIEHGDAACKRIGIEFIEEDRKFSFGRILKSNTARALRRAALTDAEKERIRSRIVQMLIAGNVPPEYKEYAKLLRRIGLSTARIRIETEANRNNPYVVRYVGYFLNHCGT